MNPKAEQLRRRTKRFAVRVLRFVRSLPREPAVDAVARQLADSGPSIDSNYRASCRARSRREFIAKLGVVVEEADESEHWLDVLHQAKLATGQELEWLCGESRELRAIFNASLTTARRNYRKTGSEDGDLPSDPDKSQNP